MNDMFVHGTNKDKSMNADFCKFCYVDGKFTIDLSFDVFLEKQVEIAQDKLGMREEYARSLALRTLPKLKRWQRHKLENS